MNITFLSHETLVRDETAGSLSLPKQQERDADFLLAWNREMERQEMAGWLGQGLLPSHQQISIAPRGSSQESVSAVNAPGADDKAGKVMQQIQPDISSIRDFPVENSLAHEAVGLPQAGVSAAPTVDHAGNEDVQRLVIKGSRSVAGNEEDGTSMGGASSSVLIIGPAWNESVFLNRTAIQHAQKDGEELDVVRASGSNQAEPEEDAASTSSSPIRMHIEEDGQHAKVWLGTDVTTGLDESSWSPLLAEIQQALQQRHVLLDRVVINGKVVFNKEESGAGYQANERSHLRTLQEKNAISFFDF